jgi:anti-sigma regulatory factor (Ser/Thr protein kinase)
MDKHIAINKELDALTAQETAKSFAISCGFDKMHAEELAVIANELAFNIIKHTQGSGAILIKRDETCDFIEIIAEDAGSGFAPDALKDGYTTSDTLGVGLSAINRLADELMFGISDKFRISAKKYRVKPEHTIHTSVSSYPKMWSVEANGDAYEIVKNSGYTLLAVIDVLGHGFRAHKSACHAQELIRTFHRLDLIELVHTIHRELSGKLGLVGSFVKVYSDGNAEFCGVGNVYTKLYNDSQRNSTTLINTEGIIGENLRKVKTQDFVFTKGSLIVMFTDGISTRLDVPEWMRDLALVDLNHQLMTEYGKQTDDKTLLLARLY